MADAVQSHSARGILWRHRPPTMETGGNTFFGDDSAVCTPINAAAAGRVRFRPWPVLSSVNVFQRDPPPW
jgi:hypothetical protein